MVTLRLRFTGLCAFVPTSGKKEMRVVLVDASSPHGSNDKPHRPVLVFGAETWVPNGGTRVPDESFKDGGGADRLLCALNDQDLRITGAAANKLEADLTIKQDCPLNTHEDQRGCGWIGNMERINFGSADIRGDCLSDKAVGAAAIARVFLSEGALTTFNFSTQLGGNIIRWEFKPDMIPGNPSSHHQALADEVELAFTLPIGATYVELASNMGIHGNHPQPLLPLRLRPYPADEIFAWIANMPDKDIKARNYAEGKPSPKTTLTVIHHFIHFYDLLKGGASLNVPQAFSECQSFSGPTIDSPKCPPTLLKAAP